MRENGYYWVKFRRSDVEWLIAYWFDGVKLWATLDRLDTNWYFEDDVELVGPKPIPPKSEL